MRRQGRDEVVDDAVRLVNDGLGASWYEEGNAIDVAVATLCWLRRDEADAQRGAAAGDNLVRRVLETAEPEAVIWLASRTISHMDEHGFPDAFE